MFQKQFRGDLSRCNLQLPQQREAQSQSNTYVHTVGEHSTLHRTILTQIL